MHFTTTKQGLVVPCQTSLVLRANLHAAGVKRNMRGDAARALCPDLQLVQVPTAHGKADLTLYRDAGKRVLDILARKATCERASSEWSVGLQGL